MCSTIGIAAAKAANQEQRRGKRHGRLRLAMYFDSMKS